MYRNLRFLSLHKLTTLVDAFLDDLLFGTTEELDRIESLQNRVLGDGFTEDLLLSEAFHRCLGMDGLVDFFKHGRRLRAADELRVGLVGVLVFLVGFFEKLQHLCLLGLDLQCGDDLRLHVFGEFSDEILVDLLCDRDVALLLGLAVVDVAVR